MIGGSHRFQVRLLHVPESMPPNLLEFGGRENPVQQRRAQGQLKESQAAWTERHEEAAHPIFARAKEMLRQAQVPETAVTTQLFAPPPERDLDASIVDVARADGCGTIVVGRESFSWWQELFQKHVADKLLEHDHAFTLWVVR
jgi:K+-sensing histidine kinase KdpD